MMCVYGVDHDVVDAKSITQYVSEILALEVF